MRSVFQGLPTPLRKGLCAQQERTVYPDKDGERFFTVVVRGSQTLSNWRRNFTAWKSSWDKTIGTHICGQTLVAHSGLLHAAKLIEEEITPQLDASGYRKGEDRVRLTGHSLGEQR